jgi:Smg protein
MKDQLFEMLLSLLEQALTQLKHQQEQLESSYSHDIQSTSVDALQVFQDPNIESMRVLTIYEQVKLTKPANQFLMRLMHSGMLSAIQFELIMNQVLDSTERYVTVNELAMMMHQVLSESVSPKELMMLEFMLDSELEPITKH